MDRLEVWLGKQAYYDDIVTERSIVRICGYPLCALPLTPQHQRRHAAQYHISLDQKKVFDLTERRKFCSNFCFKASNYYRQQLETAPLWLREQQQHGTPVQLLQLSVGEKQQQQAKKSCQQLSGKGQLVDIGLPSLEPVLPNSEDKERNETEGQSDKKEEMAGDNDVAKGTVGVFDKKPPGEVAPMAMAAKTGEVGEKSVVEGDASTREHLLQTKFRAPPHREPIEPPSVVVMRTLKLWFTQRSFRFLFRTQADELDGEEEASLRNGRKILEGASRR